MAWPDLPVTPGARPDTLLFSSFQLDLRGGRLLRGDEAIGLRPKTWAVLVHLAQRPGVLVTRDELLDAIWSNVAVTPDTVTKSIGELRLALGDDPKHPRYIQTVHGRGFRFIAASDPVPAAAVGQWSEADARSLPFVGREDELHLLRERWNKALTGERQIIFATGAAGVGKTALVDAFLDAAAFRAGAAVLIGRGICVEHHGPREGYMPVLEALERLARGPHAERIVRRARQAAPTWLLQMPWLRSDDDAITPNALPPGGSEPMLREFAALIELLAADIPIVLVLEDLHWSDPSTVDLLSYLAQRREPARLLVLGTYRPAEVVATGHVLRLAVRTLQTRRHAVTIPVYNLTVDDVAGYLEARFPAAAFPSTLPDLIHAHTDGNALFMVSVIDLLLARGWILDTGPGWELAAPPQQIELGIPDDIRRMIDVHVQGLTPAERELLEVASVSGLAFDPPSLSAALGCNADEVERRCESLARANRFLRPAGSTTLPDGRAMRRYSFTHELHRQALYGEIPDGRRIRLHQTIGESLEAAYGSHTSDIIPALALHFEKSRDHGRAMRYLSAAAARARQRCATSEAVVYLESAIALNERLPDANRRLRCELELRMAVGPALNDLHGYASDRVRENYERADALAAEVGTPGEQFEAVYALCHFHTVRGNLAEVDAVAARLESLAEQVGSRENRIKADSALIRMAIVGGRFAQGCARMESRLLAPAARAQVRVDFGPDPVIDATSLYTLGLWFLGHPARARAIARANIEAAQASGIHVTWAAAHCHAGILELLCGNADSALPLAEEAATVADERGLAYWSAMAAAVRGAAWSLRGDARAAITALEHAGTTLAGTGARVFATHIIAFLAEAHLRAGTFADGLAAIEEGLELAETTFDRSYWPELWRLKGELLLGLHPPATHARRGQPSNRAAADHAADCFERALERARESQAKSLELRAATSWARLRHLEGRAAEGRALLTAVVEWFGADADNPDLARARSLVLQLGGTGLRVRKV